jgi:hypothetical protein
MGLSSGERGLCQADRPAGGETREKEEDAGVAGDTDTMLEFLDMGGAETAGEAAITRDDEVDRRRPGDEQEEERFDSETRREDSPTNPGALGWVNSNWC